MALQTIKFESSLSAGFADTQNIESSRVNKWCPHAGAHKTIYFNPPDVTAAIVTCGGLCPGLNDVIQHCVFTLLDYGVPEENILGIMCALACIHAWAQENTQACVLAARHPKYAITRKTDAKI